MQVYGMKRLFIILLVVLLGTGGSAGTFFIWRGYVMHRQFSLSLDYAEDHVGHERFDEALALVDIYRNKQKKFPDTINRWNKVELAGLVGKMDVSRLHYFYNRNTLGVFENEEACLLLDRSFIHQKKWNEYYNIRSYWDDRSGNSWKWTLLESDRLIYVGDFDKAISLLEAEKFPTVHDAGRLLRLAIIHAKKNPDRSWEYLKMGIELNPEHAEMHLFTGQIREAFGQLAQAQTHYQLAAELEPENPFLVDHLAEFYVRTCNPRMALQLWSSIPDPKLPPILQLKKLFWSKVCGNPLQSSEPGLGTGTEFEVFLNYFTSLPENDYWNESIQSHFPQYHELTSEYYAFRWLRILQSIRDGDEIELNSLLKIERNHNDGLPKELLFCLEVINHLRNRNWSPHLDLESDRLSEAHGEKMDTYLGNLVGLVRNKNSKSMIDLYSTENFTGDEWVFTKAGYAGALMRVGWFQAGSTLVLESDMDQEWHQIPDWLQYMIISGVRNSEGNHVALSLARKSSPSSGIKLLMSEMLLESGQVTEAIVLLTSLMKGDDSVHWRATWMLSQIYLQSNRINDVERILEYNPVFAQSIRGKEIQARIHIARQEIVHAQRIYEEIVDHSPEAMAFLSNQYKFDGQSKKEKEVLKRLYDVFPAEIAIWNR